MASKERNLDSGLVVVVFIITRQGALYIILPFITDIAKGSNILKVQMLGWSPERSGAFI